jgi:hypothetical protein
MAVLAPLLACARAARAVRRRLIEEEFGRWFRDLEAHDLSASHPALITGHKESTI